MNIKQVQYMLKGKQFLVVDNEVESATAWRRLLENMDAAVTVVVGPDITDLKPKVERYLSDSIFDGTILDVLLDKSSRDRIPDNRLAGIMLWQLLERDFNARGIDTFARSGPILLTTKNDNGDTAIRSAVDAFCNGHAGSDVCWSSVARDRIAMVTMLFVK